MVDMVVFIDAKRGRAATKHVERRVAANQCVMCEGDPGELGPNGHCGHCRYILRSTEAKLNETEALRFRASLIKEGRMLRAQEIRVLRRNHLVDRKFRQLKESSAV